MELGVTSTPNIYKSIAHSREAVKWQWTVTL